MIRSSSVRLLIITDGVLVTSDRVAGNPNTVGSTPGLGVMVAFPGETAEAARAAWIVPDLGLPEGVLAISDTLATALGLTGAVREAWELRQQGFTNSIISELVLEMMVEKGLDQAVRELSDSKNLDGRFVYVAPNQSATGLLFEIDGTPYRIQSVKPELNSESILVIAAGQTQVSVFAPGNRAGVDVVILADCSGSMGVDDLTEVAEAPPTRSVLGALFGTTASSHRPIQRIRALQKALVDLLDRRLRIAGSTSRIALIAFGHISELRFPRPGSGAGMIEIDENTPQPTVRQFQDTIATLKPENWNTNIGQALQFAASHLAQYGKPNNERLIVLISDGADWKARGDDAVGELVENALEEPVSLMEHLHESMGIHLHAIGISNAEVFDRYLRRPGVDASRHGVGHRPNHQLLERLVQVGGGDPTRTGDAAVLDEYLQGLGTGVTRSIHISASKGEAPVLSAAEKQQGQAATANWRRAKLETQRDTTLTVVIDSLRRLYKDCNHYCMALCNERLFSPSLEAYNGFFEESAEIPVSSEREFRLFIVDLFKVFDEGLLDAVRRWKPGQTLPEALNEPCKILHGDQFRIISVLRNKLGSHDWTRGESSHQLFDAYEQLIGQRVIPGEDTHAWRRLQHATLDLLVKVLKEILQALQAVGLRPSTQESTSPAAPIIRW